MIQELWEQIQNGQEVRQNLSKIRQVIKDNGERRKLSALLEGEETVLIDLLRSEDAYGGFKESVFFGAYLEGLSGGWAEVC